MSQTPVSIPPSAPATIDVLIVGGGLCGLAVAISVALSGHRATVLEAFETTHPFGSGLYIPPNGTRLLSRWGLNDILKPALTAPQTSEIYNLEGGLLASWGDNYNEEFLRRYRFPLWTLHRVDLQRGLTRRALDLGVQIHYSSRITDVDRSKPTITLETGEKRQGDLVVVADGTWSTLRGKVLEQDITPQQAGYTAYRITVDRRQVQDRDLLDLMSSTGSRRWVGQGSYALCFPIRGGIQLSVLLIVPTTISSGNSSTSATIEELKKLAARWDPLLTAMFNAAQRVNKWQLVQVPPPPTMSSPERTCVLAGDCCHSFHPCLAQGLNLGLEDAATLGQLLSHVTSPKQLPKMVASYDRLRTERAKRIFDETGIQVEKLRWSGGELEKSTHENSMDEASKANDLAELVEKEWIWSYDTYEEAEKAHVNEAF